MKQLYTIFSRQNVATVWRQLTWSHCKLVLPINDYNKISYYITEAVGRNLLVRKLKIIIDNKEYERQKYNLECGEILNIRDEYNINVRNPIILHTDINYKCISEKILHSIIMENIPSFFKRIRCGIFLCC